MIEAYAIEYEQTVYINKDSIDAIFIIDKQLLPGESIKTYTLEICLKNVNSILKVRVKEPTFKELTA